MPAPRERETLVMGTLRGGQEVLAKLPVADDESAGDAQADPVGLGEQGVDGAGEV